jgi:chromosomal replication initiator protein
MNDNFPFDHFINFNNNNNLNQESKEKDQIKHFSFTDTVSEENEVKTTNFLDKNQAVSDFEVDELKSITEEILKMLKNTISTNKYNAYFSSTFTASSMGDNYIEFTVTTNFIKKMISEHYMDVLKQIVFDLFGSQYSVEINVVNSNSSLSSNDNNVLNSINHSKQVMFTDEVLTKNDDETTKNNQSEPSFTLNTFTPSQNDIIDEVNSKVIKHMNDNSSFGQKIDSNKTFDNFIVGPSNNMAHAFAISVAKEPGKVYPQLYLHGGSGLGKTHLLHAICNHISNTKPHLKICITTANAFMSEMIVAIQEKRDSQFRRKYTELVDVLIIDDIHELKNKSRTQTEFFHIFNELQSKGKQLIFTSDKPPKEIDGIEDRIKTRLSSALLIEVQQPDLETRIAILKKKAVERDIFLSDDVVNLIATCVKSNIRELEGSLIKLGAYSDLMKVDIDLEIAKEQLGLVEDLEEKIITVESIAKAVSNYFKIAIGDLRGKSRIKDITMARHISMYMTHKILKKTLEEIGDYYSKRDHTSVIHGIKKIERLVKEDNQLSQKIYEIESLL